MSEEDFCVEEMMKENKSVDVLRDKIETYKELFGYVDKKWVLLSDAEEEIKKKDEDIEKLQDENKIMDNENIQFANRNAQLEQQVLDIKKILDEDKQPGCIISLNEFAILNADKLACIYSILYQQMKENKQ